MVVGAHIDHLGTGAGGGSLAKEDERGGVHRGADDNASGVAGMLEIAQYFAGDVRRSDTPLEHDILFAAWSGEELGLRGSQAFADDFTELYPLRVADSLATPQGTEPGTQPVTQTTITITINNLVQLWFTCSPRKYSKHIVHHKRRLKLRCPTSHHHHQ